MPDYQIFRKRYLPPQTNCVLWLTAQDILGIDGTPISTWKDRSPAANDLVATTSNPTLQTNILNGLPVIRFTGGQILSSSGAILNTKTSTTAFVVWSPRSSPLNILFEQGFSDFSLERGGSVNPLFFIGNSGGAAAGTSVIGTFEIRSVNATSGQMTAYRNGVTSSPISFSGNTSSSVFNLGGRLSGSAFTTSDVAEVIIYDTYIGPDLQAYVERYLMAKYNITP